MKRRHLMLMLAPAMCALAVIGCTASTDTSDVLFDPSNGGTAIARKPLEGIEGLATIKGTVTYDGEVPEMREPAGVAAHKDRAYCCTKGCPREETWVVDPATKGVANVVVWVNCPSGKYFPLQDYFKNPPSLPKTWKEEETVDQPFCAFEPHVVILFPQYYDGEQMQPTGQVFKVKNEATIPHNINLSGINSIMQPKSDRVFDLKPQPAPRRPEVTNMGCDIHGWMKGYAWAFDHPYAAKTMTDGSFEIKNVPAGVELTFTAWQEELGRKVPEANGPAGIKKTLKAGQTELINFKVKR